MFDSIVSKIANTVRTAFRAIGAVTHKTSWIAPAAIVVLFLLL
jgi:hypothetical protein